MLDWFHILTTFDESILRGQCKLMLWININSYRLTQMALDMKAEIIQSLEGAITVWTRVQFWGCLIVSIPFFLQEKQKQIWNTRK